MNLSSEDFLDFRNERRDGIFHIRLSFGSAIMSEKGYFRPFFGKQIIYRFFGSGDLECLVELACLFVYLNIEINTNENLSPGYINIFDMSEWHMD